MFELDQVTKKWITAMILLDSYNQFNHKKWFHASPELLRSDIHAEIKEKIEIVDWWCSQ